MVILFNNEFYCFLHRLGGNGCSISFIAYTNTSSRFNIHFSALMIIYHHDRRSREYNSRSITIKKTTFKKNNVIFQQLRLPQCIQIKSKSLFPR